ncbi:MAG: enoyl-CoA hydratase/isomerase family protein, partial [Candidatus Binatia bacterium]
MPFTCITLEKSDGLARIVLNRPGQLNAINRTMLEELLAACDEIEVDRSLKVVTITGNGRAFCAGADLRAIKQALSDSSQLDAFLHLVHKVFNRIEDLQKPVVAGVHGMALAGGLEIILACDLAVAEEGALLGDQHANFGLVAGGGGTQRLSRLIGQRKAKELILLGNRLSAQEAFAVGLVNRVAPA